MRNITRSFTLLSPTDWQEDYFQPRFYFTTKITVPRIVVTTIPRVTTIIGVNKRTCMVFKGCLIQKYHLHRGNSATLGSKVPCFVTSTPTLYSDYSECNPAIRIALKLLYFSKMSVSSTRSFSKPRSVFSNELSYNCSLIERLTSSI